MVAPEPLPGDEARHATRFTAEWDSIDVAALARAHPVRFGITVYLILLGSARVGAVLWDALRGNGIGSAPDELVPVAITSALFTLFWWVRGGRRVG